MDETKIDWLEVSTRLHRCLKAMGCKTLGDAVKVPELYFRHTPNVGKVTIKEFQDFLRENNIPLPW